MSDQEQYPHDRPCTGKTRADVELMSFQEQAILNTGNLMNVDHFLRCDERSDPAMVDFCSQHRANVSGHVPGEPCPP